MNLYLAKTAGFCYGVKRAIELANSKSNPEDKLFTYGPLIHNERVTQDLVKKNVVIENDVNQLTNARVIIRSHGIGKKAYDQLLANNRSVYNATCPFVGKIQSIVEKAYQNGDSIIIVGDKNHPEVKGINGWCEETAIVIEDEVDLSSLSIEQSKPYSLVVQTTFDVDRFNKIEREIRKRYTNITIYNTICLATKKRQEEAGQLAKRCQAMLVIGSRSSANTNKLFEICQQITASYFIESLKDIDIHRLSSYSNIGITAGASTPNIVIQETIRYLQDNIEDVNVVHS